MSEDWLALVIGNSRLHWAWIRGERIQQTWDTPHELELEAKIPEAEWWQWLPSPLQGLVGVEPPPLWLASVVPQQTERWQHYPYVRVLTLPDIPLCDLYPTLGIDRAIALIGAIHTVGSPALVIDAGTALTVTGVDDRHHLIGGAILPGLRLQLRSLSQKTAALPMVEYGLEHATIPRWATNTDEAILSGVTYSLIAGVDSFIQSWRHRYPKSPVVVTGGDAAWLQPQLIALESGRSSWITLAPHLLIEGLIAVRRTSA